MDLPKAQRLTGEQFKGWVNLLMLANRQDIPGSLPSTTEIAFSLRMTEPKVTMLIEVLVNAKLIDRNGSELFMHDWLRWQPAEKTNAERSREWREEQKGRALSERSKSAQCERSRVEQSREEQNRTETPPTPRKRGKPSATADDFPLPVWLPRNELDAWLQHRKAIGHPVKPASLQAVVNKLRRFKEAGEDPLLILEASIVGGYQGLFAPPANGKPKTKPSIVDDTGKIGPLDVTPEMRRQVAENTKRVMEEAKQKQVEREERERSKTIQQNTDE